MKHFYVGMVLGVLICQSSAMAMRNLFINEIVNVKPPLQSIRLEDLHFLGAILSPRLSIGFIEDSWGNLYKIRVNQVIGAIPLRVIKIESDKIICADQDQYAVIK